MIFLHCILAATLAVLPKPEASFDVGTLHVDRYGSGAHAVIFIPGLGSGPWSWAAQIDAVAKDESVYALTLSGFDGRTYAIDGDPFAAFTHDFWTMLDEQKIEKPAVIGHSLGGTLAIALAEEHPERLSGILALDGLPVFPALVNADAERRTHVADEAAAQIGAQSPAQIAAYERRYMQTIGVLDTTLVAPTAALEAKSDPKGMAAWTRADLASDLRPDLAKIAIPFIELVPYATGGSYTQEQTLAFYRSIIAGAPQGSVEAIPDAKHFAMLDQPDAVTAAIEKFLAAVQ